MMNGEECLHKVEEMPKDEFWEKIIRQSMKTDVFVTAMTLSDGDLFEKELEQFYSEFAGSGIPVTYP